MKLRIVRRFIDSVCCEGDFYILDVGLLGFSLEPPLSGVQHPAIPFGIYKVIRSFSEHFQRLLPQILAPDRTEIRIHNGNWSKDTHGCVLLANHLSNHEIDDSDNCLDNFLVLFNKAIDSGEEVTIEVVRWTNPLTV
jgi:hypothetical protein